MKFSITFPDVCRGCGGEFAEHEARIGIVRAGSAWKAENVLRDGRQYVPLVEGAEMFTAEAWHESCAPPEDTPA